MLELLGLLVGAVQLLNGVGWIATAELVVRVLLWGNIAAAVLMMFFMGAIVIAAALGFGLATVAESGRGVVGLLVGLIAGAGAGVGAVSLFSLIWYALRKGLMIVGCLLILGNLPGNLTLAIVGAALYIIGFLWCRVGRRSVARSSSSD